MNETERLDRIQHCLTMMQHSVDGLKRGGKMKEDLTHWSCLLTEIDNIKKLAKGD